MFRPFEENGSKKGQKNDADSIAARLVDLQTFNIKAGSLNDEKSQNLYKQLNPAYQVPGEEDSKKQKGGKKGAK